MILVSTDPDPHAPTHQVLLPTLRSEARSQPDRTVAQLRRLLDTPSELPNTALGDLELLLAEVLLRAGRLGGAIDAIREAAQSAADETPPDLERLAIALLIGADIALCAGHQNAVNACTAAVNLLTVRDDQPRLLHARARHAVAVSHHNPNLGKQELDSLIQPSTPQPIAVMLAVARKAMDTPGRTGAQYRTITMPPPLSGGMFQPETDRPDPEELAYRVHLYSIRAAGNEGGTPP